MTKENYIVDKDGDVHEESELISGLQSAKYAIDELIKFLAWDCNNAEDRDERRRVLDHVINERVHWKADEIYEIIGGDDKGLDFSNY